MLKKIKNKYYSQSEDVKGLAKGVFWSVLGSVLSRVLLFITWIIMARILGKELYGEYGLIRNTILMFATFAGFGMGITGMKFIAENYENDRNKAGRIAALTLSFSALLGVIITVFVIIFSDEIVERTIKAPWLKMDFIIASFILLMNAYNGAQTGILNGLKQFKIAAKIQLYNAILSLPLFIIGAYYGVTYCVIAYALSNLVLCIQSSYHIRILQNKGMINIDWTNGWREWRLLYQYSLPAALSGIMVMPIKWISEVMLVNASGFAAMGIFSAVITINIIVTSLANTLTSPFISYMSSSRSDSNMIDKLNMLAPWFIGMIIGVPFLCFPELGGILFGKDFQGPMFSQSFIYVILFTIVVMYKQGLARIFAVKNMQWLGFVSNTIWGIILLSSFYLFKSKGVVGLSISYCIAYILVTFIMYPIYIKRKWVPNEFIYSINAIGLWSITLFLVFISYLEIIWYFRVLLFLLAIAITIYLFNRMLKSNVNYSI